MRSVFFDARFYEPFYTSFFSQVIRLSRAHTASVISTQVRSYGAPSRAELCELIHRFSFILSQNWDPIKIFLDVIVMFTNIAPSGPQRTSCVVTRVLGLYLYTREYYDAASSTGFI